MPSHTRTVAAGARADSFRNRAQARRRLVPASLRVFALCALLLACSALSIYAQESRAEYRAFWVDTFNTALSNHADVVAVVNNAKAAKTNAIFAQVRRRGDAWYLNGLEPLPDFTPIPAGFDPLQDLIATAHAEGIEVHAFVIMGAVWSKNPNFASSATLGPPVSPDHVFNRHGWNKATNSMRTGRDNWLTRTLLPDNAASAIAFQGHRFGSDFWLDFGHPDAAAYSVDVLMHLVRNYEIDGLHLDRIRYPEFTATGQTPTNGTNIGYNAVSVERFQRRYGIPEGSPPPTPGNPLWMQWRRDQVSNLVRRIYLNAVAVKPQLRVSAALIAFGGGPTTEAAWNSAEAYWRVYQDWRAWTQEGILDIAVPMNYKREHIAGQATQFNQWIEWTKNHSYDRATMVGLGVFINPIEGTLRQVRRSLAPSTTGQSTQGVMFFSMANTNSPATNGATATALPNPFSIPANQVTTTRPYADFAAGLVTGKSANGATLYEDEDPATNPTPIFSEAATIPNFAWKSAPTKGHLMGFARRADGTPLDAANVTIENLDTLAARSTATDGGGFYGGVDLAPGRHFVKAALGDETLYSCVSDVTAGTVTTANVGPETNAPLTTATLNPSAPNGTNNWYTSDVTVNLSAADECSGVGAIEYSLDGGTTWTAYNNSFILGDEGVNVLTYRSIDRAGNVETPKSLSVRIDKTAPVVHIGANPSTIWPPNGRTINATIDGNAGDAVSGLYSVTYNVTDEYGAPLGISPRSLSGNSATWTDALGVEARRDGGDADGRLYRVTATVTDAAGNSSTATADIVVSHDRRGN